MCENNSTVNTLTFHNVINVVSHLKVNIIEDNDMNYNTKVLEIKIFFITEQLVEAQIL